MLQYSTLLDRYNYLKLNGSVGKETFGFSRYLNQALYVQMNGKDFAEKLLLEITDVYLDLRAMILNLN